MRVGQTVYLRPTGNAVRRSSEIKEAVITKVGRKYFEVEPSHFGRFEIESMQQDGKGYVSDYQAYLSLEAIQVEKEHNRLLDEVTKVFRGYGRPIATFDQIKAIAKILGIE